MKNIAAIPALAVPIPHALAAASFSQSAASPAAPSPQMEIRPWYELDFATQKEEYEKQRLAWRYRDLKKQWARNYVKLARALADKFGEEEVLAGC